MSASSPLPVFGALAGLKVIDLSRVLGGPYCGQILADRTVDFDDVEEATRAWRGLTEEGATDAASHDD